MRKHIVKNRLFIFILNLIVISVICAAMAQAAVYEVGPGRALANIGQVPWEALQPGDTVLIYWRSTPYQEKWVICRQGTSAAPITVRGVAGPNGELPVIDGNGATTRTELNYWNEVRGVIKVGGANNPPDTMPRYITIENLDIRGARPPYTFSSVRGANQTYADNAAAIYVEKAENLTIRNCRIHDSGNGLFIGSGDTVVSRDVLVEGNYIYDNGIVNSAYQHNNYSAAIGITFQYNRFGLPRAGALGNNLKDRSAGLVVRYNWIEGGNRQLDLVDGEDSSLIRNDPRYRETFVYGNILIEPDGAGNRQMTHYGGDSSSTGGYRKGTLYFYNNTLISTRTDRTTLFRLSTNEERCDARNNIFYVTAAGNTLSLLDATGMLDLTHNWFKPGWVVSFSSFSGAVLDDGTSVQGSAPGFIGEAAQDYHLASTSACVNTGAALKQNVLPDNNDVRQYVSHLSGEARPSDATFDIGAYEFQSGQIADLVLTTTGLPNGTVGTAWSATLTASGGATPYLWGIASGLLPTGLSLNTQTGLISGTPTLAGTSTFTAQVSDAQSPADIATKILSIMINPAAALNITTTSLPSARRNRFYSQTLQATGGVLPRTWSLSVGNLPPGLSLNAQSGVISGTPTSRGTWRFTVRVQDSQPTSDTQQLSITVNR
jgi:hypothetical protein